MDRRILGRGDLSAGVIGMGTWRTFDVSPTSHQDVSVRQSITDEAIGAGVDFFDSSPMYGHAEKVLSLTLHQHRKSVVVATKVWSRSVAEGQRQIDQALRFFGGYVDLYQIHNLVAWRDYLPILQDMRERGQVRAIGITHYAHSAFAEMQAIIETEDIQAIQIPYNAVDRRAEHELLPIAVARGLGVVVMSPLGTGRLVREQPTPVELRIFEPYGVHTWAQILLKWVVSEPRVHVTIPATARPGRMTENAAAGRPPFFGPDERERVSWLADHYART